jgi:glycosyltransferase involved in cell wall biosynthesis
MVPARILHLHSSFSLGGKEARATRLMNLMGDRASHVVLSAVPDAMGARAAIDAGINVDYPANAPPLYGKPAPGRYVRLARFMQQFDLVLSYNWGAMDGVMAHRMLSAFMTLPPLIHHEDGFNTDESVRRNWKRSLFRRLALRRADALVVPSHTLAAIARSEWGVDARLVLIANGIKTADYREPVVAIPGLDRREGDIVIGTVAGLRTVKDLPRLVRIVAALPPHYRLVIVGEGPERAAIIQCAAETGMGNRLVMPGFMTRPECWIGHFDMLALSSKSEQQPIAVIEAMAAGLPIVSTEVGDVRQMVAPENNDLIANDDDALSRAIVMLGRSPDLRSAIGAANRARAAARFDEAQMVQDYDRLYGQALGGWSLFG